MITTAGDTLIYRYGKADSCGMAKIGRKRHGTGIRRCSSCRHAALVLAALLCATLLPACGCGGLSGI